jgi:hypothetical protein
MSIHGNRAALIAVAAVTVVGIVTVVLAVSWNGPAARSTLRPSASASGSAAASSSPSLTPTAPPPSIAPLARVASFGADGSIEHVSSIARWSGGFVAVGTRYAAVTMPNFGPPPRHEGRIWTSTDGISWADATPPNTFADRELDTVYQAADGALVIIGSNWNEAYTKVSGYAWRSAEGHEWERFEFGGLPINAILQVAAGPKGMVAAIASDPPFEPSLWHSDDGIHWQRTHEPAGAYPESVNDLIALGAGPEGFVALLENAMSFSPMTATWRVLASSDGRSWTERQAPERSMRLVPSGPNWILLTQHDPDKAGRAQRVVAWDSESALSWQKRGSMALGVGRAPGSNQRCPERVGALVPAGNQVLLSTELAYPCSEGGFVRYGRVLMANASALDNWEPLAISGGSQVIGSAPADGFTILIANAKTQSTRAEFWVLRSL